MADIIFHLGLAKTATNYFQKKIFPQLSALGNHSRIEGAEELNEKIKYSFERMSPALWKEKYGQDLIKEMLSLKCRPEDKNLIYSEENLLTNRIFMPKDIYVVKPAFEPFIIAEHLKMFSRYAWAGRGRVRVIISLRNQPDWLASRYAQLSGNFDSSQLDFDSKIRTMFENGNSLNVPFLDYALLKNVLEDALGKENVSLLIYEQMHEDIFWKELEAALGEHVEQVISETDDGNNVRRVAENSWALRENRRKKLENIKRSEREKPLKKIFKKLIPDNRKKLNENLSSPGGFSGNSGQTISLSRQLRNEIISVFEASNRKLEGLLNKKLKPYGY